MIANTSRFRTYKLGTISLLASKFLFEELDEELDLQDKGNDNNSNDCNVCGVLNGASSIPPTLVGTWKPYTLYIHGASYDNSKATLASINTVLSQARQRPLLNPPITLTKKYCTETNPTHYVVIDGRVKLIDQFITTNDLGKRFVIKAEMRLKTLSGESWAFTDDNGNLIPGVCAQPVLINIKVLPPIFTGAGAIAMSPAVTTINVPVPTFSLV